MERARRRLGVAAVVHVHILEVIKDRQPMLILALALPLVTMAAQKARARVLNRVPDIFVDMVEAVLDDLLRAAEYFDLLASLRSRGAPVRHCDTARMEGLKTKMCIDNNIYDNCQIVTRIKTARIIKFTSPKHEDLGMLGEHLR